MSLSFDQRVCLKLSLFSDDFRRKFCRKNKAIASKLSNLPRQVLKARNVLSNVSRSFSMAMFLLT